MSRARRLSLGVVVLSVACGGRATEGTVGPDGGSHDRGERAPDASAADDVRSSSEGGHDARKESTPCARQGGLCSPPGSLCPIQLPFRCAAESTLICCAGFNDAGAPDVELDAAFLDVAPVD
jgi:hypothetical protein